MKYCSTCGNLLSDEANVCLKCGCAQTVEQAQTPVNRHDGARKAIKIFMTLSTVAFGICLILAIVLSVCSFAFLEEIENMPDPNPEEPNYGGMLLAFLWLFSTAGVVAAWVYAIPFAWCLPMTISFYKKDKTGKKLSTAYKICTLIFVNLIAGIIMLCYEDI